MNWRLNFRLKKKISLLVLGFLSLSFCLLCIRYIGNTTRRKGIIIQGFWFRIKTRIPPFSARFVSGETAFFILTLTRRPAQIIPLLCFRFPLPCWHGFGSSQQARARRGKFFASFSELVFCFCCINFSLGFFRIFIRRRWRNETGKSLAEVYFWRSFLGRGWRGLLPLFDSGSADLPELCRLNRVILIRS